MNSPRQHDARRPCDLGRSALISAAFAAPWLAFSARAAKNGKYPDRRSFLFSHRRSAVPAISSRVCSKYGSKRRLGSLHDTLVRAIARPEARTQLAQLGMEPVGSSPEEFARAIADDVRNWSEVLRSMRNAPQ